MQQRHLFLFKNKAQKRVYPLLPMNWRGFPCQRSKTVQQSENIKRALYVITYAITVSVAQIAQMRGLHPVELTRWTESGSSEEFTCQNPVTSFLNPSARHSRGTRMHDATPRVLVLGQARCKAEGSLVKWKPQIFCFISMCSLQFFMLLAMGSGHQGHY